MITKTITSGQRSAQATISEETRFIFSDNWNFFHVLNMGTGNVYISMVAGKLGGDDGVITVLPGCSACSSHSFPANSVYITADNATDIVEVVGSNTAISPFKSSGSGGGEAYVLPIATTDTLGGIKVDGTTITIDGETGVASAAGSSYSLPAASAETLGGVKVGTGLSVTAGGVLSASGGGGLTTTTLFNGAISSGTSYALSAARSNYKFLIVHAILLNSYYCATVIRNEGMFTFINAPTTDVSSGIVWRLITFSSATAFNIDGAISSLNIQGVN